MYRLNMSAVKSDVVVTCGASGDLLLGCWAGL